MEITSTKLDLIYLFLDETNQGFKYKLSTMGDEEELKSKTFSNLHDVEQQFIDWAHNDIASELQGVIDDEDTIMEIRIWNKLQSSENGR